MRKCDPLKQIRRHCVECAGDNPIEVKFCSGTTCQLWYLRFGKRLNTAIKRFDKELFDPDNFEENGKFSYKEEARSLERRFFVEKHDGCIEKGAKQPRSKPSRGVGQGEA